MTIDKAQAETLMQGLFNGNEPVLVTPAATGDEQSEDQGSTPEIEVLEGEDEVPDIKSEEVKPEVKKEGDEKSDAEKKERKEQMRIKTKLEKAKADAIEYERILSEKRTKTTEEIAGKYKSDSVLSDIKSIVELELQEERLKNTNAEIVHLEKMEKNEFVSSHPELKNDLEAIEALRAQYADMSYERASLLFLAENRREALAPRRGITNATNLGNYAGAMNSGEPSDSEKRAEISSMLMGTSR